MLTTIPTDASDALSPMLAHVFASGSFAERTNSTSLADEGSTTERQKGLHALVVDDSPDVALMIATLLRYAGHNVVTAMSAAEAINAARGAQFDIVISDIGMPEMNGYELAEMLRALPAYREVPLIAVTGFVMYDDRTRAVEAGFTEFLTKPIDPTDLLELVKRLGG